MLRTEEIVLLIVRNGFQECVVGSLGHRNAFSG